MSARQDMDWQALGSLSALVIVKAAMPAEGENQRRARSGCACLTGNQGSNETLPGPSRSTRVFDLSTAIGTQVKNAGDEVAATGRQGGGRPPVATAAGEHATAILFHAPKRTGVEAPAKFETARRQDRLAFSG